MATTPAHILHLSLIAGCELRDAAGGRLGKVNDVIVRLDSDYPPVSGVLATVAGRQVFVPAERWRRSSTDWSACASRSSTCSPSSAGRRRCC